VQWWGDIRDCNAAIANQSVVTGSNRLRWTTNDLCEFDSPHSKYPSGRSQANHLHPARWLAIPGNI
jgi:hypothetical protein